jgi:hypothetical protein
MEKHIVKWSYWFGMMSAVLALVMRAFNALGIWLPQGMAQGRTVWYMSFYKGAFMFFLIAIATANYIWSREAKS